MNGNVEKYFVARGYGFILGDDGKMYFVWHADILDDELKYLEPGQFVSFEPKKSSKGYAAVHVSKSIDEGQDRVPQTMQLKPNPFTPQDPVSDPMLFAGREADLTEGVDSLLNERSILVTGGRGIGKSSYSYQLLNIASGDSTLLDELALINPYAQHPWVSVGYTCFPHDSLNDIVAAFGSSLTAFCAMDDAAKSQFRVGLKFGVVSAEHVTESTGKESESSYITRFLDCIIDALQCMPQDVSGICFLVDEVDQLPDGTAVAPFFKAVIEGLRLRGAAQVCFIVTGVSGTVTDLMRQHASASRLFNNIHLDPMPSADLKDIVIRALKETGVKVDPAALDEIVRLSGGRPASVQLIGYYAYRAAQGAKITRNDVFTARDLIVRFPRKQYYREMRDELLEGGPTVGTLLSVISGLGAVTPTLAADRMKIDAEVVRDSLEALRRLGHLSVVDGRYSFSDPLFRTFMETGL